MCGAGARARDAGNAGGAGSGGGPEADHVASARGFRERRVWAGVGASEGLDWRGCRPAEAGLQRKVRVWVWEALRGRK